MHEPHALDRRPLRVPLRRVDRVLLHSCAHLHEETSAALVAAAGEDMAHLATSRQIESKYVMDLGWEGSGHGEHKCTNTTNPKTSENEIAHRAHLAVVQGAVCDDDVGRPWHSCERAQQVAARRPVLSLHHMAEVGVRDACHDSTFEDAEIFAILSDCFRSDMDPLQGEGIDQKAI